MEDDSPINTNGSVDADAPINRNPVLDRDAPILFNPKLDPDAPILNNPTGGGDFGGGGGGGGGGDDGDDGDDDTPPPPPGALFPDFLDVPILPADVDGRSAISVGQTLTDEIEATDDADLFTAVLDRGVTYVIDVVNTDMEIDPIVSVLDVFDDVLQTDPGSASLQRSTQFFTPSSDGIFQIAVGGFFESTGEYEITLDLAFPEDGGGGLVMPGGPDMPVAMLSGGGAAAFAAGGEDVADLVIGLVYEAGLGRTADEAGLDYWSAMYERGMTLEEIADAFITSPEFTESVGDVDEMSDAAYAAALYRHVLDRDADADGLVFWTEQLALREVDEADLLIDFALSDENLAGTGLDLTAADLEPYI
jgi:hypothetical protein